MRARGACGLLAALSVGCGATPGVSLAQLVPESPRWASQNRNDVQQALPQTVRQSGMHRTSPAEPSPGGPISSPSWPQFRSGSVEAPSPSVGGRQQDARPRRVNLDGSRSANTVAGRRTVAFAAPYPTGSIVIVNRERALYLVEPDGKAIRFPVAIGSFTEEWTGIEFITDKKVNPTWHPVQEPGKEPREPVLGGDPTNPLGVRALYLGRTLWRIHGTPAAESIGQAVSAGCIRMHNDHVIELYDKAMLGTEVYVVDRLADPPPSHRGKKVIE